MGIKTMPHQLSQIAGTKRQAWLFLKRPYFIVLLLVSLVVAANLSFKSSGEGAENTIYKDLYRQQLAELTNAEKDLAAFISATDLDKKAGIRSIKEKIAAVRLKLKINTNIIC